MAPNPGTIANLLNLLRNDVDTALLENFATRQENKALKEELGTTLYTEDAAVRLLAQYKRENQQLKDRNQKLVEKMEKNQENQPTNGVLPAGAGGGAGMGGGVKSSEMPSMPSEKFLAEAREFEAKFREARKAKKKEGGDKDDQKLLPQTVTKWSATTSVPLHSTTVKGIRCCVAHPTHADMLVTGGMDGSVIIFHKSKRRQVDHLKGSLKVG